MKSITVREMKAHWAAVESQVRDGETFEVLNRGKPTVRIVPAKPAPVLAWGDNPLTAVPGVGTLTEDLVAEDRGGRE
jgi:antitoxin (DNA-binding transcriptional repressor) of toxin-antitoxin stability system